MTYFYHLSLHTVYSELTTHNLTHATKCNVNSVESDRSVTLLMTMN